MAEMLSDPDDTPLTKEIKIFNVKETLNSKNLHHNNNKFNQISPLKSTISDQIPSVENDIKLEEADINQIFVHNPKESSPIKDSNYYIHCKCCLLILSTENKLQSENGRFYLIAQPILSNLTLESKEYMAHAYKELQCKRCRMLIGTIFTEEITLTQMTYFIKKKITPKEKRQMIFKLLGLRHDLLLKLQQELIILFNDNNSIVSFDISKQTKESLEKFKYQESDCDILFIVHKIEGRVFLLGKNGFYNEVIKEFNRKNNKNIYFILLFKEIEDKFSNAYCNEILNDLINKGGQNDLKAFKEDNRILCINDLVFEKDFKAKSDMFKRFYEDHYIIFNDNKNGYSSNKRTLNSENNKRSYYDSNDLHCKKDEELIHDFVAYFYEGKNKLFANCSML